MLIDYNTLKAKIDLFMTTIAKNAKRPKLTGAITYCFTNNGAGDKTGLR